MNKEPCTMQVSDAATATDVNSFQVGRFVSLLAVDFTKNFVLFTVHIEISHTLST